MRRPRSASLRLAAAAGLAALAACANPSQTSNPNQLANPNQDQQAKVSPMPFGYVYRPDAPRPTPSGEEEGKRLDEVLAVVEGRPITRRRLVREAGGRPPGIDDAQFERQIQQQLRRRVTEELFVRQAKRIGIQVPEQRLDEALAEQKARMVEEASKLAGRPVRFEEILADRGLSEGEFRETIRRRGLYELYLMRVLQGLGPARPQVEMDVSPAEVRRIYQADPRAFDVKPGVKFAAFQVKLERFLTGEASVEEAEAGMRAAGADIARRLQAGEDPAGIARSVGLEREKGEWNQTADFLPSDSEVVPQVFGPDAQQWLFAAGRRPRDAVVLTEERPGGPLVLGVLEVQEARARDWDEVRQEIVEVVRLGRRRRVEATMILDMVSERNVVWPQRLADDLAAQAREMLAQLDKDPVFGAVRFQ